MANSRRKRASEPTTARPKTETAEVAAPLSPGKSEFVTRISDTLTSMFNRRQISQLQYGAGDRYRSAFDMLSASSGGSMDFERARGSSGLSPTPALTFLIAAEIVSEARKKLYPKDYAVIHRVAVQGLTIEQAARQLYDERFDGKWRAYLEEAGRKFRNGLDALAGMWWPDSKAKVDRKTGEEIRPIRGVMIQRAESTDSATVAQSSTVVHATRDKIYRGPQKRARA